MENKLSYRGYLGTVEFSGEDNIFYGRVAGIRDLVSYEGENMEALAEDFRASVDDCIELIGER